MNQYDPMKESASSEAQNRDDRDRDQSARSDTYTASDNAYTYGTNRTDEGRGYTNPDGSHGFIYNPPNGSADRNRSYRGVVIALSTVLATLVVGSCCFFGAFMAVRSWNNGKNNPSAPVDSGAQVETSNGLIISDDQSNQTDRNETTTAPETNPSDLEGESNPSENISGQVPLTPPATSIDKLPSKRQDADGDGKAEVETDERGEVLTSAGKNAVSVATVFSRVSASVVEISTETIVQSGYIGQYVASGAGSGVVISKEGYIVTNHHVIDGANSITVRMSDGTEFPATLVGTDEQTDIAVLWIDAGQYELTVATLGSSFDLVVGEDILAIGNPLGSLGGTLTEGMISATAREISISGVDMTLLQISAPINPGNSGGGLFNLAGELVGVVNAKMSSTGIEGLGFAIPIDTAYEIILELIEHGYVRGRPTLDFNVIDMNASSAYQLFGVYMAGVYVYDDDHPVMMYGDLIISADGQEVSTVSALEALLRTKKVGDTLELTVYRDRKSITVTVTIAENRPQT
jgi:serine protease Do